MVARESPLFASGFQDLVLWNDSLVAMQETCMLSREKSMHKSPFCMKLIKHKLG